MKKVKQLVFLILSVTILAACAGQEDELEPEVINNDESNNSDQEPLDDIEENRFADLIRDQYEGLELTAVILERKEILPGSTIPVTITIINNGDKEISYAQGSGSFEIPQALILDFPGLQPILPKNHLGVVTMDMVFKQLLPGEQVQYTVFLRAIEPNENFIDYTNQLWMENEEYIGDVEWSALLEKFPELKAVEAGAYEGYVYFLYAIEDGEDHIILSDTGYAKTNLTISVAE